MLNEDQNLSASEDTNVVDTPKEIVCLPSEYKEKLTNLCKPLQIYFGSFESLFTVSLIPSD